MIQMTASSACNSAPEPLSVRLRRGSVFAVAVRFIGIGLGCVINVLLAGILGKADFGRYSLILTTMVIFSTVARFGFDRLLMCRLVEIHPRANRNAVTFLLMNTARVVVVTTLISAVAMAVLLSRFANIQESGQASLLIVTATVAMGLMTVLYLMAECFRGCHDLKLATFYDANRTGPLICLVFSLLLLTGWVVTSLTLLQVMLSFLAAQLIVLVLASMDLSRTVGSGGSFGGDTTVDLEQIDQTHARPPAEEMSSLQPRSLAWAASSIAATQIIANLIVLGDTWVAGATVSAADLGNWSVVTQFVQLIALPLFMINMTFISAIPSLYRQGHTEELQRILQASATSATVISLIPLALLICIPGWVISTVYGPHFMGAARPLAIISLGKLVFCWTGACGHVLMLTGNERFVLLNNVVSALILLFFGYLAAISHGITGLACIVCGVTILSNIVNWLVVRATVGIWTHASLRYVKSWRPLSRF
jgi:O-antigen/teichoic acid export membrane protein